MTALINIPQYATQYYIISLSGADISGTTLHMTQTQMAQKEQKEFFRAVQRITLIAQYETALHYENSRLYRNSPSISAFLGSNFCASKRASQACLYSWECRANQGT
jgi:hypothetical protein